MAEVAKLVGIEQRSYLGRDGRPTTFCGLHLVYLEGVSSDVVGCKVESVSCPRKVNPACLVLDSLYQLEYEIYNTKNGKAARLVDLLPVDP